MDDTPAAVGDKVLQETSWDTILTTITRIDGWKIYTAAAGDAVHVPSSQLKSETGNFLVRMGGQYIYSEIPF